MDFQKNRNCAGGFCFDFIHVLSSLPKISVSTNQVKFAMAGVSAFESIFTGRRRRRKKIPPITLPAD